jgi:hypothetical protein
MTTEPTITNEAESWRQGAASAQERVNRLTEAERALHHAVLRGFPQFGGPPPLAWLTDQAPRVTLTDLAAKDVIQLDPQTGAIVAAYPFSGVPTTHRVTVNGGATVYAMCAIDALGIPFMLGVDATVRSEDPMTGDTIRIEVRNGQATWEPAMACMFAGCVDGAGPIAQTLCPMVNFFSSPASAEAYAAAHPDVRGNILYQAAAVRSGQRTFGAMLTGEGPTRSDDCCSP